MRPEIAKRLGHSTNELAALVLRVLGKLAPCTETSLIAHISGDYATSGLVFSALIKLKALGLIHSADGQIAITDIGRQFLSELPVSAFPPRMPYCSFWATLVPTAATDHAAQLQRFCQDCLTRVRGIMQRRFPLIWSQSVTLVLRQLTRQYRKRTEGAATLVRRWHQQAGALLRNELGAVGFIVKPKFAGRGQWAAFAGALVVAAVATAGGFAFLSGKEAIPTISEKNHSTAGFDERNHSTASATELNTPSRPNQTDAIRVAIQGHLSSLTSTSERKREHGALVDYYSDPTKPLLWVDEKGLTGWARSVMEEIAKADEYGLNAADYKLPKPDGFPSDDHTSVNWLADAEIKVSLAVLLYAEDARGGRLKPTRLSKYLDPTLALPDPLQVMDAIAVRGDPAAYLRSFQPIHPQFEALRQKLLEVRREGHTPKPNVIIPEGPVLKKGVEHAQVALLRKRLEVSSSGGNERLYGELLDEAVRRFQTEHGVVSDGVVGASTRRALNQQAQAQGDLTKQRLILLNMERWRWLPRDLGAFYINVNVPDFMASRC